MRTLALIFVLTINIEAFELEFTKPNTNIEKTKRISSKKSIIKFVPISSVSLAPTISSEYKKDKVFLDIKLNQNVRYDPYAESKKLRNGTDDDKTNLRIYSVSPDNKLKHIIYRPSKKSLSQKKFIQSLASFNQ